jgi:hypothetical protein
MAFTAATNFAESASFGASRYLAALVRSIAHNKSYSEALGEIQHENEANYAANPASSWIGWGAGLAAGAGAINLAGKGVKALGAADRFNPFVFEKGAKAMNAAKMAAFGGTLAGTEAAIEGRDVPEAAVIGGVGSAVLGGIAGKIGERVGEKIAPYVEKAKTFMGMPGYEATADAISQRFSAPAWKRIGDILGYDVNTLKAAALRFKQQSGSDPTLADLVALHKQGTLQEMASQAPTIGNAMRDRQILESLRAPQTLRGTIERVNGGPLPTEEGLAVARKTEADALMEPIRNNLVRVSKDDLDMMTDNILLGSVRKGRDLLNRLNQAMASAAETGSAELTLGDIDTLRKAANNIWKAERTKNPSIAVKFGELAETIGQIGRNADSAYGAMLDQYAARSRHLEGFKYGKTLQLREKIDDVRKADVLRSAEGSQGYREGLLAGLYEQAGSGEAGALGVAKKLTTDLNLQRALNEVMPGRWQELAVHGQHILSSAERTAATTPRRFGEAEGVGRGEAGHLVGAVGSGFLHSIGSMIYHVTRAIAHLELPMSEGVQKRVAQLLTDPKTTDKGIAILERAGATRAQVQNILRLVGTGHAGPTLGVATAESRE